MTTHSRHAAEVDHPVHRAHLTGRSAPTPPIARYDPSPDLVDLIRHYWVPVWSLGPGVVQTQRTLQYPGCLIVVAHHYARFYGVATGRSEVTLEGSGWAFGVALQPASGRMLLGRPLAELTDQHVALESLPDLDGALLRDEIRATIGPDPEDPDRHRRAIAILEACLRPRLRIDPPGATLNEIVTLVESDVEILRVDQLAAAVNMSLRSLSRLVADRVGVSPKWLIQRRRLHDAVAEIKSGGVGLADLAHRLGYTDQAHFTRDFRRVTGTTPGAYAADQPTRTG